MNKYQWKHIKFPALTRIFLRLTERFRSDEGLTLQTSALDTLYSGKFTLSARLIKSNNLVIPHTDAKSQFLYKLTSFPLIMERNPYMTEAN